MESISEKIGENIRKMRMSKDISQLAVAYSMNISQAAYSKIERGETEVKAKHLYELAAVLNVPIYDLLPPSSASSFEGNDYLLKPVVTWLKMRWYGFIAKRRLRKVSGNC